MAASKALLNKMYPLGYLLWSKQSSRVGKHSHRTMASNAFVNAELIGNKVRMADINADIWPIQRKKTLNPT